MLFVAWAVLHSIAFVLFYGQMGAVVNQFGYLWDYLGAFFLLRFLIRDDKDVERAIRVFALIAVVVAAGMLYERLHDVNVFGLLGGVRVEPELRNGQVRAQGPFEHALLAGAFGAILLPLFFWLWRRRRYRITAVAGMVLPSRLSSFLHVYEYGADGVRGGSGGHLYVGFPKAYACSALGHCMRPGFLASGHESAGLDSHWPYRSYWWIFVRPSRSPCRSLHTPHRGLVAAGHQRQS